MTDMRFQEYSTLREELLQAKRYVFERPLLIVALGVGGLTTLEVEDSAAAALVLAGLILFNFWFTANRLMSAARIVAYIQLQLEEGEADSWAGWESSLRFYRKWLKLDPAGAKAKIDEAMDKDAVPDAMMHYPPIYYLHIALMAAAAFGALAVTAVAPSLVNVVCSVGVLALAVPFSSACNRYRPAMVSALIERNRVIWGHVFEYMRRNNERGTALDGHAAQQRHAAGGASRRR